MPNNWIESNGKKILYQDFRGLSENDMLKMADETNKLVQPISGSVLILINVEDTYLSEAFMNTVKESGAKYKEKIGKSAIVGISGIKKIIFNSFNAFLGTDNFKAFDTEDEAINYLTK